MKDETPPDLPGESKGNVAFVGRPRARILAVFEASPTEEFNPTTLARRTGIPGNVARATLSRLKRQNRIFQTHRGFYCLRPRLTSRQLIIHEARVTPTFHNLSLVRSGPLPPPKQQNEATLPPSPVAFPSARWVVNLSIGPDRTLTLIGNAGSVEARLGASENPLTAREMFWLKTVLEVATGAPWSGARVAKVDANIDLPVTLSGAQELTLGDLEGACLAIYAKAKGTRVELRNYRPEVTVEELLENLARWFGLKRNGRQQPDFVASSHEGNQGNTEATPISFQFLREEEVPAEEFPSERPLLETPIYA